MVLLGGGRRTKEDRVDPAVGVSVLARLGDEIREGQPIVLVHHRGDPAAAVAMLRDAYQIGDGDVTVPPLIHEILRPGDPA